jgi:diguanylate cyclase (GGDEF)-like protein/PAS domain S-box-containing protein
MRTFSEFGRLERIAEDRGLMPLSFVGVFSALLLFGGTIAVLVAAGAIMMRWMAVSAYGRPAGRMLLNASAVLIATASAAGVRGGLVDAMGAFTWPMQALPIAAAIVAYCFIVTVVAEVIVPLAQGRPVDDSWPAHLSRHCASHVVGAGIAVGITELLVQRAWELLPVAAVPLYCAYRAYATHLDRSEYDYRHREVSHALNQGLAVIDHEGHVTIWNEAAERILDCPRDRVVGRQLADVVPALGQNQVVRAMQDVVTSGDAQTIADLRVSCGSITRLLEVKVIPVTDGVTLVWQDITRTTELRHAARRSEQRLALVADGAHEGLWEWDLHGDSFYASGRWKEMLGLTADAGIDRVQHWLERIHAEDLPALKHALDAHLSNKSALFECSHRLRHEDGTYRRFRCRGMAARGSSGRAMKIAGSLAPTRELTTVQEQAPRSVDSCDPLTGLWTRGLFVQRLAKRLAEFKQRPSDAWFAALHVDLDRFKVVNEIGHVVGDELLIAVARRLESCLRQGDGLARLAGDEFAILLSAIGEMEQANAIAFRIQKALNAPFSIAGREVFTSASIGIACAAAHYNDAEEIMRDADTAMHYAKSQGKARHELFDAGLHARVRDRLDLENDLRHAVGSNGLEVHYQPIVSLRSRRCVGFESLVRWTRDGKAVSPAAFVPIAEELGLIEPLGTWVLEQACRTFAEWQRQFPAAQLDYITVNVSSRQLMQQNFQRIVERAVDAAGLRPCDLRLEITETALLNSPRDAAQLLQELRDFGVKIYLDDFGTGYSSLSHLHRLPVDALKIDRSFVSTLAVSDRPAIVESILALARTLNTGVVAEGIESEEQASELERLGCTHAQGFYFSRPLAPGAAEQLLAANTPLGHTFRAAGTNRIAV